MQRMLSGIKPTGRLTLGNYLGAIRHFIRFQDDYEMFVFIANLHAVTTPQDKTELRTNTRDLIALYLACGLDPQRTTLFLQTDVLEHANLAFIFNGIASMGELSRMTQYKDKASKGEETTVGVFAYPVLMAADILIYDPQFVPVGDDQKQHVELTRDIAIRFNNRFGDTFVVPEPKIATVGARIMSLANPTKKMSKSDDSSEKGVIYLLDDIDAAKKKIRSAVTDSEGIIAYDEERKPGVSNLLTILSSITGESIDNIVNRYQGSNYAPFKDEVAEAVGNLLQSIQSRYHDIISSNQIETVLAEGAARASMIARKKLLKVEDRLGLRLKFK